MCCTRRFASCLGPRIYRLLIPRNRGGPLMCGVYLKVKCSNGGPENYTNCWFCKYPVTSHVGTFLDRAVASLWLRRVSTLWQLLRKRRHRRDIGHVGYSVRHLISPIQIHSVRSLHSLWYLSFIACWTQQGILNFQLNFLNLPMVAGEKKNILWALQKRADMLQLHRPYHYCQAAPGMNIVARVSGSLESTISAVGGVLEGVYVKFELIMMVGCHGFCWFMIDHQSVAFSILTTRFKFDRG